MQDPVEQSKPPHRIGTRKKLLFSLLVVASILAVAELTLGLLWDPPPPDDPFVGFSASTPLLVTSDDGQRSQINPAKRVWFNAQEFPSPKPAGTFRIVCLGGSTTYGRPFDDATSFCGWLRTLLPMVDGSRNWEVVNAGGISYASYRVARVMEELSDQQVDLFILYTGQNEFLERRTYGDLIEGSEVPRLLASLSSKTNVGRFVQATVDSYRSATPEDTREILPDEVDEILNHTIGPTDYRRDPQWSRRVVEHFRLNLKRMQRLASDAGAKLVVITPVSNLRDCAPFKSDFADGTDSPTRQRLLDLLAKARQESSAQSYSEALATLESITETDDQNADVAFRLGETLLALGRPDEALSYFQLAIDLDICPLRATSPIKQCVREFIAEEAVIGVDAETHLASINRKDLGHACLGSESLLDHVHPTIDVHREIALLILQSLHDEGIVSDVPSIEHVQDATETVEQQLDPRRQAIAFRNLAKVMHWAGKEQEARRHALDALKLMPDDLESRFVLADCLERMGDPQAAMNQYTRLFEMGEFPRAYQPFGELLASQGHYESAKAYLMQAIFASEGNRQASAYESLGRLHQFLGEDDLAAECFEMAKTAD